MAAAAGGSPMGGPCAARRVSRFGPGGGRQGCPLRALARLDRDGRAHVPAGPPVGGHRGTAADPGAVGALEGRRPAPHAGRQRPDDGAERRLAPGGGAGRPAARRRGGHVRPPLPDARRAARLPARGRLGHRPRLGDERRFVLRAVRPGSVRVEGVLEEDRRRHARGSRRALPLRFRAGAGAGRDPVDGLLSGGRRRRHHRIGQLRPTPRKVVPGLRERAVRAAPAGGVRGRAREADLIPGMGPLSQF